MYALAHWTEAADLAARAAVFDIAAVETLRGRSTAPPPVVEAAPRL